MQRYEKTAMYSLFFTNFPFFLPFLTSPKTIILSYTSIQIITHITHYQSIKYKKH